MRALQLISFIISDNQRLESMSLLFIYYTIERIFVS